jgi:hypothetical protein
LKIPFMHQRDQIRRTLAVSYWQRTIVLKLSAAPEATKALVKFQFFRPHLIKVRAKISHSRN